MALVVKNRVQENSTTSGTGTLTLTGAVPGFQTFSTAIGNGNTTYYTLYDNVAQVWEVGIGTVGAGTLARTTVLSNSSGTTSPLTLAGNSISVWCDYPSEKAIYYDANGVATIGSTLGYSDTGIVGSFASTVAGYNQVIIQNKSSATNASSNLNVSNDTSTSSNGFAELGINSSTFSNGAGCFNIAGAAYLASAGTDLSIGTYSAYNIHFATNSNTTDSMTIYNDGGISLGSYGDPGIGNIAVNKIVPGYTQITAAAGTTVLTAASTYYQKLVGSTTQTIQLPDATTLLNGTTFVFDNDSSGVLTITDASSTVLDTIQSGSLDYFFVESNATVAGSWGKYSFLPSSYDFSGSTASFGSATITNATWNGSTIGTGYGGTGLTTFTGANYALYSTSSSNLTAGTLPVAAGGTSFASYTAGDLLYASGSTAFSKLGIGTNGYVLTSTGSAPQWTAASSIGVTSFQTSLSGLTPSSSTTGAVTLAGTLGATSGGTGLSTYTTGDIIYASATNTLSKLAAGTNGYILSLSAGVPTWIANTAGGASYTVTDFTATAGQTLFTVSYVVGQVEVYRNGVRLAKADFTATNGTSITLTNAASLGDIIEVVAFNTTNVSATIAYDDFSGNGSTTVFTMTQTPANSASVIIAISGVVQDPTNYTVSGTTLTFSTAPPSGTNNISCRYLGLPTTTQGTASVLNATNGIIVNNASITASYTIPSGSNAMSTGPVTLSSGVTVTIPSGSRWAII